MSTGGVRMDKRVGLQGRGEGSDWLGSYTWPHTKEVWTRNASRQGIKDKFSYGKSNAPLQRILNCDCHSLFREGNCERGRKGTPRSSSQPVKTDGHSFQNKINLLKKCL
jgi:hypothetical protein